MATTSRLKAIDQKLLAIITARPNLAGVQVERGKPATDLQEYECIWIDNIRMPDSRFASLSPPPNKLRATIEADVFVEVKAHGNDAATLRDRAADLANEVEEALRSDPSLTDSDEYGRVQAAELDDYRTKDGRVALCAITAVYQTKKG